MVVDYELLELPALLYYDMNKSATNDASTNILKMMSVHQIIPQTGSNEDSGTKTVSFFGVTFLG